VAADYLPHLLKIKMLSPPLKLIWAQIKLNILNYKPI